MSIHPRIYLEDDYIDPRVINWSRVIQDVTECGTTYWDMCQTLDIPWSTFNRYRHGTEPKHSIGSAILLMHSRICGGRLTQQRIIEAVSADAIDSRTAVG